MNRQQDGEDPNGEESDSASLTYRPVPRRGGLGFVLVLFVLLGAGAVGAIFYFGRSDGGIPRQVISLAAPSPPAADGQPSAEPSAQAPTEADAAPAPRAPGAAAARALVAAPVAAVVVQSRQGPLPQIARDGRTPMEVYARPFDMKDPRPRVALIITGLGLSRQVTDNAIASLPPQVTLSFAPYPKDIQLSVATARAAGHEVMIEVPMEPFDYPQNDPGPYTLLTRADSAENLDRLEWVMSRFTGYSGILNEQGDKMLGSVEDLKPILNVVKTRGLYFVDRGEAKRSIAGDVARAEGVPFGVSLASIDSSASREGIDLKLLQLEESARQNGAAIGIGLGYPVTIDRITAWAADLDAKGVALAPVSAVVQVSPRQQAHP